MPETSAWNGSLGEPGHTLVAALASPATTNHRVNYVAKAQFGRLRVK